MARNVFEDYMHITGYLPVLKHPFPHGGSKGRLMEGETWKTEAQVREYMVYRGFGSVQELAKMHFDNSHPKATVNAQVWGVTVTHSGVIKNQYPDIPPIVIMAQPAHVEGPRSTVTEPLSGMVGAPVGKDKIAGVGKQPIAAGGIGMVAIAVIVAIGYMLFVRRGK
jgi:hypothetical protein